MSDVSINAIEAIMHGIVMVSVLFRTPKIYSIA